MNTVFACFLALFFVSQSTFITTARADAGPLDTGLAELAALQGALDARDGFITALEKRDYSKIAHDAFEQAVQAVAEDVKGRGDEELANELLLKWHHSEAAFYFSEKDLGDHAPLFPWLSDYISKLTEKYGTIILNLPYVKDLITLNFAVPVVFSPHGKWQVAGIDSRIEYRKHFIPFANIVTYYVSLYGCKVIMAKQGLDQLGKQLCGKAAERLQFAMGRYIAPQISDWIFRETSLRPHLGADDLRYSTAEELQRAIQRQN